MLRSVNEVRRLIAINQGEVTGRRVMATKARGSKGVSNERQPPSLPDELWDAEWTATYLGLPVARLYRLNHDGTGPRYRRLGPKGRLIRYDPYDIAEWLNAGLVDADLRRGA